MVTLIPKNPAKTNQQQQLFLYVSVGLLMVVLSAYLILIGLEKRASAEIDRLKEDIENVASEEDQKMKDEVLAAKEKIEDFSLLIVNHRRPSRFFEFLEEITHPKVGFTEVELNPVEMKAQLKGFSVNGINSTVFEAFGQQMYIFQEQELIKEVRLISLSLGTKGEAAFLIELFLDPKLF